MADSGASKWDRKGNFIVCAKTQCNSVAVLRKGFSYEQLTSDIFYAINHLYCPKCRINLEPPNS